MSLANAHYGSVADMLKDVATPTGSDYNDKVAASKRTATGDWDGIPDGTTWEQRCDLWLRGDPALIERLRAEIGKLMVPVVKSIRRRGVWADAGDELSRDRLYEGSGEPWRTARRVRTVGPTRIRLLTEIGGTAMVSAEALFYSGACSVALAEALGAAGYPVEIIAANFSANVATDVDLTCSVTVKPFTTPVTLAPLLATAASGGFWRSAVFAAFATYCGKSGKTVNSSMGHSRALKPEYVPAPPAGTRVVLVPRITTAEQAHKWLEETVAALEGAELKPATVPAVPATPAPTPKPVSKAVPVKGATIAYKGQEYRVDYAGNTKFGKKAKLIGKSGKPVWVNLDKDGALC